MHKSYDLKLVWRFIIFFIATAIIFVSTNDIFASNTNTLDPLGEGLCSIYNRLSGNLGKAISMIAIFAVGVGLFMGKINWPLAVAVAMGILILFKSGDMLNFIIGTTGQACSVAEST
ncbi:MAG: TrbC/VirB2 family protein [Rickettsiaceae bacterium]|nr:TrbC/VirB2 family protein [Rickettsiaceae bacterium]